MHHDQQLHAPEENNKYVEVINMIPMQQLQVPEKKTNM